MITTTTTTPETPSPDKNATRKPMPAERTLRHEFGQKELIELGKQLGDTLNEARQVEADFDRVKGDFKARTAACDAKIGSLRDKVTSGYELRLTKCEWRFDDPKASFKTLYRLDTNLAIATEPMTEPEKQAELPLEDVSKNSTPGKPATEGPKAARVSSGGVVAVESDGKDINDPDASKAP